MRRNNVPSMDQSIESTCTLCQVRIIGILGTDPIEDEIQAVGIVRDACPQAVEIEAILDVGPFDLAEHFMTL